MLTGAATSPGRKLLRLGGVLALALGGLVVLFSAHPDSVSAAQAPVDLGLAGDFAVLAQSDVTDTTPNPPLPFIRGDVGLSPATGAANITGILAADVSGKIYTVDGLCGCGDVKDPGLLTTATTNWSNAFTVAMNATPSTLLSGNSGDNQLGVAGTIIPGIYHFGHAPTANLTGTVTLNGNGVYIFQASSDLVTAVGSTVALENGAQAACVFWEVGTQATLGNSSVFVGTIMAGSAVVVGTGVTVLGRLLAGTAVTLAGNDTITVPTTCSSQVQTTTTTTAATTTTTAPGSTTTTAPGSTTTTAPGSTTTTAPRRTTTIPRVVVRFTG